MFTSMFALEMLLKLLACGPLGYIQNPYNIFDGIIVVIRWVIVVVLQGRGAPGGSAVRAEPQSKGEVPLGVFPGGPGDAQGSPFLQNLQGAHTEVSCMSDTRF